MTCYNPLVAYRSEGRIVFNSPFPLAKGFNIKCGQCIGCRLDYSRQWAVRCVHEAQMHENNCFITLTFNPEALEARTRQWSLDVRDFQLFMKRLRKKHGKRIRFFHCGEYGDKNQRPHYHALLFGFDFPDKKLWSTREGVNLYISESLQELWPHGFSTIGDVTFQSAAYCSRYIMKKIKGEAAAKHYEVMDEETGEVWNRDPEYCTMSRKPGIGRDWFDKYKGDVFPNDYVVINGKKIKPPRYYDSLLPEEELEAIKKERQKAMPDLIKYYDHNMDRLFVEEAVKTKQLERLIRNL